ncbi:hypothetical protein GIB67_022291 [Kingdonia uniflora]|uniref:Uncharacterized protein n=1 Tax=Kingdonia uniflora TaxID=39325 RepID=A0A7J7KW11_9MAGN|nr:hypothetical protein GIB67_022291 [Kingdonia uniflora]
MFVMVEDETVAPIIKKDLPKGLWEDEDEDENDVKDSHKDDDEPSYFGTNITHCLLCKLKPNTRLAELKRLYLQKNEELYAAEEGLSGLKEVQIEYWGNGHTLEVPEFIGDYKCDEITITAGSEINLDVLVYEPSRDSPTLWEIGIEKHMVKTRIYRFRQYGLWERYAKLYPDDDFIFKIGINDYHKDWLFVQVPRFE